MPSAKHLRALASVALLCTATVALGNDPKPKTLPPAFHTSDRCFACHTGLTTPSGKDVSIGFDWRASIMANSARDPYWQAGVRREDMDHPGASAEIEDACADCHMPIARYEAKLQGKLGGVFEHLPFDADPKKNAAAKDGVSCSTCHQISTEKLGTPDSFNGGFVVESPPEKDDRPEYGPYVIANGQAHVMQTSTGGFRPTTATHIQSSEMCATCHTLYTKSLGPDGKQIGIFPEQMVFLEWKHSDYNGRQSCQSCHMPEVAEPTPISVVLGEPRIGMRQHTFVGANVFMLQLLNRYRADLSVAALPTELTAEAERTREFVQSQAARVVIQDANLTATHLQVEVLVRNLTGHKLPTAFPSRRAWLHLAVHDRNGDIVFESGKLNPDGSIAGNINDQDPLRFEPHFREITRSDQVQIFEDIMGDRNGQVTTGLVNAVGYLKDNRLLPRGFNKESADKDVAVHGEAADDPNFTSDGDLIRYSVPLSNATGPFHIEAELWYQPIGFRWAHNLQRYDASETRRFLSYYTSMPAETAIVMAHADATR